jgi:hypothetical protein
MVDLAPFVVAKTKRLTTYASNIDIPSSFGT